MVKGLGDGILAAFGAAADAVAAATAIQRAIDRANRRVDDARRLAVRVGLSAGDVSWEDGDCHGTPVVTAARLCDRAVGGQILVDDLVRGLGPRTRPSTPSASSASSSSRGSPSR